MKFPTPPTADNINQLREKRGLSINELADASGLPRTTLKRKLQGGGDQFTTAELTRLAGQLNVAPADLMALPKPGAR